MGQNVYLSSKLMLCRYIISGYSEHHANHSLGGNNILHLLSLLVYVVTTRPETCDSTLMQIVAGL